MGLLLLVLLLVFFFCFFFFFFFLFFFFFVFFIFFLSLLFAVRRRIFELQQRPAHLGVRSHNAISCIGRVTRDRALSRRRAMAGFAIDKQQPCIHVGRLWIELFARTRKPPG